MWATNDGKPLAELPVNSTSAEGVTPLMHAIDCSLPEEIVSGEAAWARDAALLDTQDKEGLTALHYAVLNEDI